MHKTLRIFMIAGPLAAASPSLASDYAFRLHNRADGYTINGFYTYQDGQWSKNWLSGRVVPANPSEWIGMAMRVSASFRSGSVGTITAPMISSSTGAKA